MFDDRRLDTLGAINDGVLTRGALGDDWPAGRTYAEVGDYDTPGTVEEIVEALDADRIVSALNYYGIPTIWRERDGLYRGRLAQYCNITERHESATAAEAAEWYVEMSVARMADEELPAGRKLTEKQQPNRYQIALRELGRNAGANGEVVEWMNALFEAVGKIRAGKSAMEVRDPHALAPGDGMEVVVLGYRTCQAPVRLSLSQTDTRH